ARPRCIETLRGAPESEKSFLDGVLRQVRVAEQPAGQGETASSVGVVDLRESVRITGGPLAEQLLLHRPMPISGPEGGGRGHDDSLRDAGHTCLFVPTGESGSFRMRTPANERAAPTP